MSCNTIFRIASLSSFHARFPTLLVSGEAHDVTTRQVPWNFHCCARSPAPHSRASSRAQRTSKHSNKRLPPLETSMWIHIGWRNAVPSRRKMGHDISYKALSSSPVGCHMMTHFILMNSFIQQRIPIIHKMTLLKSIRRSWTHMCAQAPPKTHRNDKDASSCLLRQRADQALSTQTTSSFSFRTVARTTPNRRTSNTRQPAHPLTAIQLVVSVQSRSLHVTRINRSALFRHHTRGPHQTSR